MSRYPLAWQWYDESPSPLILFVYSFQIFRICHSFNKKWFFFFGVGHFLVELRDSKKQDLEASTFSSMMEMMFSLVQYFIFSGNGGNAIIYGLTVEYHKLSLQYFPTFPHSKIHNQFDIPTWPCCRSIEPLAITPSVWNENFLS